MDAHTLELLGYAKIREMISARASSSLGKELAAQLAPLADIDRITLRIRRTSDLVDALAARLPPPLGGLRDVRIPVKKAILGVLLEVEAFVNIRDVLDLTGLVHEYWERLGDDYADLSRLLSDVPDMRPTAETINAVIDPRGKVRDEASTELRRIRVELALFEERIQNELRRMLRQPEIRKALRYANSTVCGEHHVLPVSVNYRHKVPGIIHRTSPTGETLYVEPARVAEISAGAELHRNAEQREIRRILRDLTGKVAQRGPELLKILDVLAELDLVHAQALCSRDFAMSAPEIAADGRLRLIEARHPLLEDLFRRRAKEEPDADVKSVVPVSIRLGDEYDLVVITGPNTGGKTVALKSVGLLAVMALSGMHIPAKKGSQIPILDDVLADIGDEQSIEQSLSTFSAHVARIAEILRHGSPRTLVLLDELGSGTDPSEGAALGRAILDELIERGCRAMVTTHLGDLKTYAFAVDRAENAAVEFDSDTLRPTYRLVVGQFGESCALKIARRLKLPKALLKRANKYLRRRRGRKAGELSRLQEMRHEAEKAREEALQAQAKAEAAAAEFRRKSEFLRQEANVQTDLEKARNSLRSGDRVRVARFDKTGVVVRVDPKKRLAAVTVGAIQWEVPLDELLPLSLESS